MASTPVQKELGKIAADYRRYRILLGLAKCWAGAIAIGLILLVLYRYGGFAFPLAAPILICASFLAAGIVFWRNSRVEIALRDIARQVEKDDPHLNSLLLAALEQQPDASGNLNFLQLRVIREATEANRKSPWNQRFVERLFKVQCIHLIFLCGAALVFLALGVVLPKPAILALRPGAGLDISPGNISIEKGRPLSISAKFNGGAPGQANLVYQTPSEGQKTIPMTRSLSDPLFGATLTEVNEKTTYRIEFDGHRSGNFTADVFEYPDLKRADAELNFPKYTGFQPSKIEDTKRISAVEGTDVRYTFFLNKPVKSARLIGTNENSMVLTNVPGNSVAWLTEFPLEKSGQFKLELIDEAGRTNKLPPDFVFVALENQRPKLKLQTPKGDPRVSALQEVKFEAQAEDDFGVSAYGLAYTMAGKKTEFIDLSRESAAASKSNLITKPHEPTAFSWMLALEKLAAEPGELVSYYLWAEDTGPDGQKRRTESDMFFAEVRPFEEIFRESNQGESSSSQQQQQAGQNPATKLLELEKQIITATWNIQRRESGAKPGSNFQKDTETVRDSQRTAWQQAQEMKEKLRDEKSHAIIETAIKSMDAAVKQLADAAGKNAPKNLPPALDSEQSAYQALLKLQAREYQVSRSRSNRGQQANQGQQRAQQQLDQLELKKEENRYEKESEAAPLQNAEQRETLQVLNRLKELARRQQDMTERLKEFQSALNEAKTPEEREKLERLLKRLQEEQQQIVQDMDEVRQRMAQAENQSRMSDARQKLDNTRQQSRDAAQQMQEGNVPQAVSSSSRAQKDLQKLSDDFRKATSSQFAEDMRQMRQQARDLETREKDLAHKFEEMKDMRPQRSLSNDGPRKEIADGLAQQRSALTNLLQNVRQVTEQAENAEPLLSKQLYDTLRKTSQEDPDKLLDAASQLVNRNNFPDARRVQEKADQTIQNLREGIERAATSVLGDEAESLRYAERELRDLAERVEKEMRLAAGSGATNSSDNKLRRYFAGAGDTNGLSGARSQSGTNTQSAMLQSNSTNGTGRAAGPRSNSRDGQQSGTDDQQQRGNRSGGSDRQLAQNDSQQQGDQSGSRPNSDRQGDAPQSEGRASRQGSSGAPQGREGREPNSQASGDGEQGGQEGAQQGQGGRQRSVARNGGNRGDSSQSPATMVDRWVRGASEGGGGGFGGGGQVGPITGEDYTRWSDRLRDIEEVLQNPVLRNDVARVRERARQMRVDFTRNGQKPAWDLVNAQISTPLRVIQDRVAEELARLGSRDAIVPVDRDPVPQQYSDLVNRYYERLGRN